MLFLLCHCSNVVGQKKQFFSKNQDHDYFVPEFVHIHQNDGIYQTNPPTKENQREINDRFGPLAYCLEFKTV